MACCPSMTCAPQLYTNFSCCPAPSCTPICGCNSSNGSCDISKLADFCHYGGGEKCCDPDPCCKPKPCCCPPPQPSCCKPKRKCPPPMPPCAPTCITDRCKDLPCHRLRNVDVLEELCYFVPGDECKEMDCYTIDCCGNVEKVCGDDCDCCCCPDPCCSCPRPVKYSRRQRFTFNDAYNGAPSAFDPWPFNDNCGGCGDGNGRRGGAGAAGCGGRGRGGCNPLTGGGGGGGPKHNPCLGGRQYTYRPESPIDCSEFMPPDSGIYYFDRQRRVFIPEKELPKPPEIIEKEVTVPDVEEYEILEDESSIRRRHQEAMAAKRQIQPVVQPIIMGGGSTCNPCQPPCNPCNPCGPPPCNPCNPCAPPPCNPCCPPPCNPCCPPPCNPCAPPPCNPCCPPPCNPCCPPPCNPCNPCMPCGPVNPFMNCCGGVLPMVIPMCPQQPMGGGMPMMPPMMPPPPMPKKKKKKKSSSGSGSSSYPTTTTTYDTGTTTDNIIVPGAPEDLLLQYGASIPPDAYGTTMGDEMTLQNGATYDPQYAAYYQDPYAAQGQAVDPYAQAQAGGPYAQGQAGDTYAQAAADPYAAQQQQYGAAQAPAANPYPQA